MAWTPPASDATPAWTPPATDAPATQKASAPTVAAPKGAGWSWMDKLRNAASATGQSIEDLAKSAAVPYLNAAGLLSHVPIRAISDIGQQAQADASALQKNVSPISQIVGGLIGGAPLAVATGAAAAPLAAGPISAAAAGIGTGAALGAATSNEGSRGAGAMLGAAGGAIPGLLGGAKYGIGKLFAPGIKDAQDVAAVQAAQAHGLIVPPSELTGTPQVGREMSGSFGPFAQKVPEQNIHTFGRQVFNTLGLKGETNVNAQSVQRAISKIGNDLQTQIGPARLTIDPKVAAAVDSAITQNKPMLADMAVDPESKGVASALYRAQGGDTISGKDYFKVSQWLRNKAATTNDGATRDALSSLEKAWQNGASGDTARVGRALRVYRTRMSQALDLQSMMTDPGVAAGTKPVNPAKLYTTMAKGKPSVLSGQSPYKIAPLAQSAAVTQAFGTGTKIPGWAERAASLEGLSALGDGKLSLPYTGKLNLAQKALFGSAGVLTRSALKELATPEGQKMLLGGYKLTPQQLQSILRYSSLAGTTGSTAANTSTPSQTLP